MAYFEIGPEDRLYYEETEPSRRRAPTFVFINALLDERAHWNVAIAPPLRAAGCGVLLYDQRGQGRSVHAPRAALTMEAMASDLRALLEDRHLETPLLVGEAEGAQIAARAVLAGAEAAGLVLLNGLRADTPQADWAAAAAPHLAARGGTALLEDALLPMLVGPGHLAARGGRPCGVYQPLDSRSGLANRLRYAAQADWRLPWERLTPPTLAIVGLQDRLFLDRAEAAAMAGRMPRCRLEEWPEAGRFLSRERPEALTERLLDFGETLIRRAALAAR